MTDAIPSVPLTQDLSMPMVGFGTWQLTASEAYDSTRVALDAGYRHIDTATLYGNEADVGRAIEDSGVPRDELFVTTKLPPDRANRVRATLEMSLRLLDLDHVDLWLIHWPPSGTAAVETWREFLGLRDDGLTTSVGVSNYDLAQLDELADATGEAPSVNQISWSPARFDRAVLDGHRKRGVVLEGYSPIKRTNLRDSTLIAIADAHGVTPAHVVLRWHIEHGIPVIPRSSKPERVRANFDVFGFSLTDDEVQRIDAMGG
ncbi:MAG TPA: aldo/keto reductase [Micromonosporaceae bacterium]|jgi:diketogulonate reductase-like aldo/keto reductase